MTRPKIAYQGEPGANSHIACNDVVPDHEPLPCPTFEDALAAIADGTAALGMIPIENSLAGRVADIHHFLPASGLHIIGEYFLRIRFQLMAVKGASLETIRSVHSHIHALGQCRSIIRQHGWTAVTAGDTAGAAREIAEAGDPTKAALAPVLAADIYGLSILARDVEDAAHNTTRFVILAKEPRWAPRGQGTTITTFIFRVRNVPAALYKGLGGFATNGVNMTKLESYMVGGEFAATQFLADVEGHPDDAGLARALEELTFFSREVRVLGVYPAAPFGPNIASRSRRITRSTRGARLQAKSRSRFYGIDVAGPPPARGGKVGVQSQPRLVGVFSTTPSPSPEGEGATSIVRTFRWFYQR